MKRETALSTLVSLAEECCSEEDNYKPSAALVAAMESLPPDYLNASGVGTRPPIVKPEHPDGESGK